MKQRCRLLPFHVFRPVHTDTHMSKQRMSPWKPQGDGWKRAYQIISLQAIDNTHLATTLMHLWMMACIHQGQQEVVQDHHLGLVHINPSMQQLLELHPTVHHQELTESSFAYMPTKTGKLIASSCRCISLPHTASNKISTSSNIGQTMSHHLAQTLQEAQEVYPSNQIVQLIHASFLKQWSTLRHATCRCPRTISLC